MYTRGRGNADDEITAPASDGDRGHRGIDVEKNDVWEEKHPPMDGRAFPLFVRPLLTLIYALRPPLIFRLLPFSLSPPLFAR